MIARLAEKIGHTKLRRLADSAEHSCKQEYSALLEELKRTNDSEQIYHLAHSLKNTASLFDCQGLVGCLEIIEQGNMGLIRQDSFQQQLEQEYQACLEAIKVYQHL